MAKTSNLVSQRRMRLARIAGKLQFKSRYYNRCGRCGRSRGYYRKFDLCRICLRELVHAGEVPGVRKASW